MKACKFYIKINQEVDPEELEKDYQKLGKYLVEIVIPHMISKYRESKKTPFIIHYRCSLLIFNFITNWMFIMFAPDHTKLDIFNLLKNKGCNGLWNNFYSGCGANFVNKQLYLFGHLGNINDQRKVERHPSQIFTAFKKFNNNITKKSNTAFVSTESLFQDFTDVWKEYMPSRYKQDNERA